MFIKKILPLLFLFTAITVHSQKNLQISPEKPKPGDLITITYEPAGDIANTILPVEGVVYLLGSKGQAADEVMLKKEGKKYSATIQTDTSHNFIYLGFSSDNKFDNNFNEGYWIQLYDGDKVRKGSHFNLANFYQYSGSQFGVERNNEKALEYMEKEFSLYPENKKTYLSGYLRLISSVKKAEAPAIVQKEIEALLKQGLKEETDYSTLESLYTVAKLPEQAKLITAVKKEKYPSGKWVVNETMSKFYAETDVAKKEQLLADILKKVETEENWKPMQTSVTSLKSQLPYAYIAKKDWEGLKSAIAKADLKESDLARIYNYAAKEMQKAGDNLKYAEELSRLAVTTAKSEWEKPSAEKPQYYTKKQWEKSRENTYAMFAETYAMALYKSGEYKKGLSYAKDAIKISKGKNNEQNKTYSLLAEKSLPMKQYKKELEQFVKDGKATAEIREILQRAYVKENKSEAGFNDYIADLEKESYMKMIAELRKAMKNDIAPSFALLDLDGKKVDIGDLKGKVVVVDFWATWCGPCKASFPGMQKMVNKYKEKPDVRFVFVDTWERVDNKEKNALDFITSNNYTFQVLMDNDSKVVEQFKVEGIPTKFVIDKEGMVRFKSVGYNGSDDKLISELTAMIEMASEPAAKAF